MKSFNGMLKLEAPITDHRRYRRPLPDRLRQLLLEAGYYELEKKTKKTKTKRLENTRNTSDI
jgi:hypothetical protein